MRRKGRTPHCPGSRSVRPPTPRSLTRKPTHWTALRSARALCPPYRERATAAAAWELPLWWARARPAHWLRLQERRSAEAPRGGPLPRAKTEQPGPARSNNIQRVANPTASSSAIAIAGTQADRPLPTGPDSSPGTIGADRRRSLTGLSVASPGAGRASSVSNSASGKSGSASGEVGSASMVVPSSEAIKARTACDVDRNSPKAVAGSGAANGASASANRSRESYAASSVANARATIRRNVAGADTSGVALDNSAERRRAARVTSLPAATGPSTATDPSLFNRIASIDGMPGSSPDAARSATSRTTATASDARSRTPAAERSATETEEGLFDTRVAIATFLPQSTSRPVAIYRTISLKRSEAGSWLRSLLRRR